VAAEASQQEGHLLEPLLLLLKHEHLLMLFVHLDLLVFFTLT
jgi:hypothetical protein